jgi:hypothetical protein
MPNNASWILAKFVEWMRCMISSGAAEAAEVKTSYQEINPNSANSVPLWRRCNQITHCTSGKEYGIFFAYLALSAR